MPRTWRWGLLLAVLLSLLVSSCSVAAADEPSVRVASVASAVATRPPTTAPRTTAPTSTVRAPKPARRRTTAPVRTTVPVVEVPPPDLPPTSLPPTVLSPIEVPPTEILRRTVPPTTVPPPPSPPPPAPAPCRIAYLADSVGHDLQLNGLGDALGGVGCSIAWSRVRRGSRLAEGVAALRGAPAAVTGTDAVLVLQGYSKAQSSRSQLPVLIDQLMAAAGARTVVWPLYGPTSDCSAGYVRALGEANRLLVEATGRWPNLRLADYPQVIGSHPEYSQRRCPHLLSAGSAAVSQWLAGEVRRLVG